MPRAALFCPPRLLHLPACLLLCAAVAWLPGQSNAGDDQLWSVHAFGLKVGELTLSVEETETRFEGKSSFKTTGLAGALRRIRFTVTSKGKVNGSTVAPASYNGFIDTGRRVSETALSFSGGLPRKVSGEQSPAVPIPEAEKRGALDPMTMMWLTLRDQSDTSLCNLQQTQFDGTRLVRITLKSRSGNGTAVTCTGTYDRIGGYSKAEIDEMKISPLTIAYTKQGAVWKAEEVRVTTRHGKAKLFRQR